MLMTIVSSLLLFYFSHDQSKNLLQAPNKKNQIVCIILGIINVIFLLQVVAAIFNDDLNVFFTIIFVVIGALNVWFAYKTFIASIKVNRDIQSANTYKFCPQCGNQFNETDEICTNCGYERQKRVITANINIPRLNVNNIGFWISFACPIILLILIFQKWLKLPVMNSVEDVFSLFTGSTMKIQKEFSLFEITKAIDRINSFASSSELGIIANIIKIAAVLVIILQLICLFVLLIKKENIWYVSIISAVITSLTSIGFLICIGKINSAIAKESYSLINNSLQSTAMPYLAILFSVIGAITAQTLKAKNSITQ